VIERKKSSMEYNIRLTEKEINELRALLFKEIQYITEHRDSINETIKGIEAIDSSDSILASCCYLKESYSSDIEKYQEINEKIGKCYALELMKEFQNETKD
jgi:hypothetical protein